MTQEQREVAIFDEEGILVDVRVVPPEDHVTDRARNQMRLPAVNDVRVSGMIGRYRVSRDYRSINPIIERCGRDIFLEKFGHAMLQWGQVESAVQTLFIELLSPKNRGAAAACFHAIINFRTKCDAINAMIEFAFNDLADRLKEWKDLRKKIEKANCLRNHMAHLEHAMVGESPAQWAHTLQTPLSDVRRKERKVYTETEVDDALELFPETRRNICDFVEMIAKKNHPDQ